MDIIIDPVLKSMQEQQQLVTLNILLLQKHIVVAVTKIQSNDIEINHNELIF